MKSIQVVKENRKQNIFQIKAYSFVNQESEKPAIPIYRIIVKKQCPSPLDVRYWLEEVSSNMKFLIENPDELTKYIKKYEENIRFDETYLFHDLRTRYLDILLYDEENLKNNVLLVGYTLLQEEVCLAIKGFSLSGLVEFSRKIIDYCENNEIPIECNTNLRWVQLEHCILPEINTERNNIFEAFLYKTLESEYCKTFLKAFKTIDFQGYLGKKFYDEVITVNEHERKIRDIQQFTKYFSPFWKTNISIKNVSRTVLYLHDELLNDESINQVVYTIKPHLMQYYQLHWFEDFCNCVIKNIKVPGLNIINIYAGRRFNFFQSKNPLDIREVDIMIGVQYHDVYKIIAIECKKTLSNDEVQSTNKITREKVLKSHCNIIDAYIHIGCFNNDVDFDKKINGSKETYKQGLIQMIDDPKVNDAPYYGFSISSIENLELKLSFAIKEICTQW